MHIYMNTHNAYIFIHICYTYIYTAAAHMNYGQQLCMMQGRQRNLRQREVAVSCNKLVSVSCSGFQCVLQCVLHNAGEVDEVETEE